MKKYNSVLKDALNEIKLEELDALPNEDEIDYEFSEKFTRQTDKLIKKEKTKSRIPVKKIKIAASVAIILLVSVSLSHVDASQNKFFDFFINIYNSILNIEVNYDTDHTEQITTHYFLNEIPEGYTIKYYTPTPTRMRYRIISADEKSSVYFTQRTKSYFSENNINTNGACVEYLTVNSVGNVICVDNGLSIHCFWEEFGYAFELIYPSELGKEYMYNNIGKLKVSDYDNVTTN